MTPHDEPERRGDTRENASRLPIPMENAPDMDVRSDRSVELESRIDRLETVVSRLSEKEPLRQPIFDEVDGAEADQTNAANELTGNIKVVYKRMEQSESGSYKESNGSPPTAQSTQPTSREEDPAMIIYTYINKDKKQEKVKIEIKSSDLVELMRNTMQKMIEHEAVVSAWKETPVTVDMSKNRVIIIHCLDDLRAAAVAEDGQAKAKEELACFLRHFDIFDAESFEGPEAIRKDQQVPYHRVWMLFRPGSQVVAEPFRGSKQIFVVHGHVSEDSSCVISCWCYDWDGGALVRHYYDFKIAQYEGRKPITELPLFPINSLHVDGENTDALLRATLIKRGKRFRDFCLQSLPKDAPKLYQSSSFFLPINLEEDELLSSLRAMLQLGVPSKFKEVKAEKGMPYSVVIDASLCRRYGWQSYQYLGDTALKARKACECSLCSLNGLRGHFEHAFMNDKAEPGEHDDLFALLPSRLHGYNIMYKMWGQMQVDAVEEETISGGRTWKDAWDELAVDPEHKVNIEKMVSSHFDRVAGEELWERDHTNIQDLVARKGEGLVILLHGVPGVGKTMTAEALARSLRRRLLRIDASDFQHDKPAQVSDVFKRYFHMASSWGSLLLLDEADVFLQVRKRAELEQNALVSILLRELEYFQGVLIMTTNRIVSIDYAVQSRIHYAVRFNELHLQNIVQIWNTFRRQLNPANCTDAEQARIDSWFEVAKDQLKNSKFTGRDIRNVFIKAQLLGYPMITLENLKKAVNSTTSFRGDLEKISQKAAQQNVVGED